MKWLILIPIFIIGLVLGAYIHEKTDLFGVLGMSGFGDLDSIGAEVERAHRDLADAHSRIAELNQRDEDRLAERVELIRRIGELEGEREATTRRASERLDRTDSTFESIGSVVDAIEAEFLRLSGSSGGDD